MSKRGKLVNVVAGMKIYFGEDGFVVMGGIGHSVELGKFENRESANKYCRDLVKNLKENIIKCKSFEGVMELKRLMVDIGNQMDKVGFSENADFVDCKLKALMRRFPNDGSEYTVCAKCCSCFDCSYFASGRGGTTWRFKEISDG